MPLGHPEVSRSYLPISKKLFAFLLLDQYQSGIWGASLHKKEVLYGARSDPGSITVSVGCALAMGALSDIRRPLAMTKFREYLVSRHSESGAFGMRQVALARGVPHEEILEHTRHTATGALLFLHMDGPGHDYVVNACAYLLDGKNQTRSGYWAERGAGDDSRADPITVGSVVEMLESLRSRMQREMLSRHSRITRSDIEDAINRGLEYLFEIYPRTANGGWLYRHHNEAEYQRVLSNEYSYTANVLRNVALSVDRTGRHLKLFLNSLEYLLDVALAFGGGIPCGRSSNVPDIAATVDLAKATSSQLLLPNETKKTYRVVRTLVELPEVFEQAGAYGWGSGLEVVKLADPSFVLSDRVIADLAADASLISLGREPETPFWREQLRQHGPFINELLQTKARVESALAWPQH